MNKFIETINEIIETEYFPITFCIITMLLGIIELIITIKKHEGE